MRKRIRSAILLAAALALLAVLGAALALAEDIDPDGDGSQYAWGENVGWINAEPGGEGGWGLWVWDNQLEGYMWGENIGWISTACNNTMSCGGPAGEWKVTNDGAGNLAGYAWGENVGWISFSCQNNPSTCATTVNYGVTINPTTGVFSGYAWGENIGWISFSDNAPVAYGVVTSWREASAPVGGIAELPEGAQSPASQTGSSAPPYAAIAAGAAAALALISGAWYARRRRLR